MKVKLTTILALLVTIAAAVFFAHTTKIHRIYDSNINNVSYTDMGVPEEGQVYTQEFICMKDHVDGFNVKTGVAGDYSGATVILEVKDAQTQEVLVRTEEKGTAFRPRKVHYFRTSHFENMKGRDLLLSLSETGASDGNGITFYYAKETEAPYFASFGDTVLSGVMPLGVASEGFDIETFFIFLFSVWFIWGFMWFLYKLFQ